MTTERLLQCAKLEAQRLHTYACGDAEARGTPAEFDNTANRLKNMCHFIHDEMEDYRSIDPFERELAGPKCSFDLYAMRLASQYAKLMSGCKKVQVGCLIVGYDWVSFGANISVPNVCHSDGCQRITLYGEDSKNHRNPEDCRACHSEIDALAKSFRSPHGAEVYVTRYPCEGCARALAAARVAYVHYGRNQPISEQTMQIFDSANVQYTMESWWHEEDITT